MSGTSPQPNNDSRKCFSSESCQSSTGQGFEFDEPHIRRIVAANPSTPEQVLARLAQDSLSLVRRHVAENPHTTVDVLSRLASDSEPDVRLAVVENIGTPPEILARLACDPDLDVRYGVAENPHIPMNILATLARDDNPYIRCRALKTLRTLSPDLQSKLDLARGLFFT
jgi:hypothetical protein